uniref:Zinc finger protein n=1 Tax=Pristionchus pacificus TaxID=54126 RepID=A0A2A6BSV9_PRIPA|eukprot:PDM68965.1 zinc finger protein [Pristionchus pacificus]
MAILRSLEGLKCEMSCDVTKATQLSDRANSLFKSMRAMINWMIAKEDKRRTNEPSVKKAEVEMPEDELFGVSDIEINEDSDQDQYPKDQVPHSNDEIDSQSEILTKKKRVHKDYGRHQCGVCHKVFPWRQSLNLHKREHFDDVEKRLPYQCEICSKRFGHPTAFKNHKIIHLPADHPIKKALTCEICAKVFNFKQRFDRHMKTHLGELPKVKNNNK